MLYLQAGAWAVAGAVLAVAPGVALAWFSDQRLGQSDVWLRLLGIQTFGLAMLVVLVAHRIDELWWWSWAFAFANVLLAATVVLNLAFGLAPSESVVGWWLLAISTVCFALGLLYGLFVSSRERPIPWETP
ncbi:hypothetical protein BH20ACT24_BH20ACT24_24420 [soil metagenome]